MSVLRGTILACLCAVAGLGEEGAYTANRMPGTNVLWTAARTSNEVERVRSLVETGAVAKAVAVLETTTVTRAMTNGWEVGSHAGLATTGDVAAAIAAIPAADAFVVRDSADTNRWWRFEGTNAVQYELGALTTNYTVTLSADFAQILIGITRPDWTNNVWPFLDGDWAGTNVLGDFVLNWNGSYIPPGAQWFGTVTDWAANPLVVLTPNFEAQGTATVNQHIYYPTNATGNVIGPIPTNLVTYAQLLAWWVETGAVYATTQYVAQAIAEIPVPDLSSRVAVQSGHATNLAVSGWLALPQSEPTNLVLRLVCSNEHIIVQEVYQ